MHPFEVVARDVGDRQAAHRRAGLRGGCAAEQGRERRRAVGLAVVRDEDVRHRLRPGGSVVGVTGDPHVTAAVLDKFWSHLN